MSSRKCQIVKELANPESEEFQALEDELFDFFTILLADQIANGFDLEIEIIVRPPAPAGRKRRSGEASVDVNVRLHNHLNIGDESDDENLAHTTADLADIAHASISANIAEKISTFESDFIDSTAANDIVVSEPGVTLDHVEGINCMFNNGNHILYLYSIYISLFKVVVLTFATISRNAVSVPPAGSLVLMASLALLNQNESS